MSTTKVEKKASSGISLDGFKAAKAVHRNDSGAVLAELAVRRGEGLIADNGALVVNTGSRTGRSPNDKFFVKEPGSEGKIWWGKVNRPIEADKFDALLEKALHHLNQKEVFVQDLLLGADPGSQVPIRVVTENAWHALFARQLFIRPTPEQLKKHVPEFTVVHTPDFLAEPKRDGTQSEAYILIHFGRRIVLIGGTQYAGEVKKSMFTLMNYLLPQRGIMAMHSAANVGKAGDTAIFFGLSGTGKTSLSADPERQLIGDDEHGWNDAGVFNFEGGCYAKCIRLSAKDEPQIYNAIRFGSVVENVVIDPSTRKLDYNDDSITENTRVAYPLDYVEGALLPSRAGHPKNIILLTCDAFGVLPPIARLTNEQAMYHFMSGYTAKIAGTEAGVKEPTATFSTCFGAPFMALHPTVYAELLREKMKEHGVHCWLVNTGWTGGGPGVGNRMKIGYTRAMVRAVLDGRLSKVKTHPHPIFQVGVPESCPDVPAEVLDPRKTWKDGAAYDKKARELAAMFVKNFEQFAAEAAPEVKAAGPKA
jgi:phosphoenolpyruvate carboxykinase (ATP)